MFSKGLPFCIDHLPGTSFAHEVHSLKKGHLSIKKYLAQIKGTCDLLEASSHPISTEEQVEFMLVGLSNVNTGRSSLFRSSQFRRIWFNIYLCRMLRRWLLNLFLRLSLIFRISPWSWLGKLSRP
ncbi:hypothetical protein V6Z12_D06G170700 [Gossypium hirsutum]